MADLDDILEHYGVKGMRWGVRKSSTRTPSSDYTESRALLKKHTSELSTAELKKLNNRLNLERNKKDLTNEGGLRKIRAGTAAIGAILAVGTTVNLAIQFAQSPAGKAIKGALDKARGATG